MATSDGGASWVVSGDLIGASIACSSTMCLSVGGAPQRTTPGSSHWYATAFVSTTVGQAWSAVPVPRYEGIFHAASCDTAGNCVVVGGGTYDGLASDPAVILTYGLADTPSVQVPGTPPCADDDVGPGIEPRLIFLGCATAADNLNHIRWTSWTSQRASGTAVDSVNDCTPDCAGGTFTSFPVEVELTTPATSDGRSAFGKITVTPTTAAGAPATTTRGWGFAPGGS